jgi:hypothetical protein
MSAVFRARQFQKTPFRHPSHFRHYKHLTMRTPVQRRFRLIAAAVIVLTVIAGAVVRNQVKVYRNRQARAAEQQKRASFDRMWRELLFDTLRPSAIANCNLQRFGETHDGGYLMCGNLLRDVRSGYSYGIAGYDKWGCDISTALKVPLHQYDCFNTTRPACPDGKTIFHAECIGDAAATKEGRPFDTLQNQFVRNGDGSKRIVMKIDVEGAEWNTFLFAPDDTLKQIDQMAVEFHWELSEHIGLPHLQKYLTVVRRLKQFFEIAHLHFNNASCVDGLEPFPSWAYEVLFVNKRLAVVDASRSASGLHPLDAPNNPAFPDCQPR